MHGFTREQEAKLTSGPRFTEQPEERICPACQTRAIRVYISRYSTSNRASRITYAWCANCRRYKGWTGPDSDGLRFNDPLEGLPPEERLSLKRDPETLFRHLDELWDSGELPQHFDREG
ncbi:hypothetical protein TNCT1_03870 [Streptomyces sp. 1-11]|nr:hypothetical protein TNCT1_03870 [Streptomyces sp. 1-11]